MPATLRPLRPDELPALREAARADAHAVLWPTHVAVREDGRIVGYASVCATPVVQVWLDSREVKALETVRLLAQLEREVLPAGLRGYVMPCAQSSPFFPRMERLGFARLGECVWHYKPLQQEE